MHALTISQIDLLKQKLELQQADLKKALRREAPHRDQTEDLDALDGDHAATTQIFETNLAVARHLAQQLQQVERALNRSQTANYGVCIDCIDAIGFARLIACPSAERCERCQEVYEYTHGSQLHPSM
jgi:RNA polymerase-binding transcription factor DksA